MISEEIMTDIIDIDAIVKEGKYRYLFSATNPLSNSFEASVWNRKYLQRILTAIIE